MKKVAAEKIETGMILKGWDDSSSKVTEVSKPFDGWIGDPDRKQRTRWGRVVTLTYDDGYRENVFADDLMYVYEEGE